MSKSLYKLCCTKCKVCKNINTIYLNKLIAKFGTTENMVKSYVCRSCKSAANGKSKNTNKTNCSKCGKPVTITGVYKDKLIAKFGSVEAIKKNYVCRSCASGKSNAIHCSKCGEKCNINGKCLEKNIAKFGSLDELKSKYVCRSCRKKLNCRSDGRAKPGKGEHKPRITTQLSDEKGEFHLPDHLKMSKTGRQTWPMSPEDLKQSMTCWRYDIWSDNKKKYGTDEGFCNGCPYYENSCGDASRNLKDLVDDMPITRKRKKNI